MTEPKHVTPKKKRQEAVDAYALAVGRLSIAWNYLHEALGDLFALVIGGDAELVRAAWGSNENDRALREMLRAVIKAASPERWKQTPTAPDDLLWVLGRADALSDVRNDAIHVLVWLHIGAEIGAEITIGVASPPRGKRERKLFDKAAKGKKLLDEFAKGQQDVEALSVFVLWAIAALTEPDAAALTEPDRQEWPTRRPEQIW